MRCYVVGVEQIRRCTSFPLFFFFFKRRLITATGRWKRHVYTWLVLLLLPWTIFPSHRDFNKIWSFGYRSISGGFLNWTKSIYRHCNRYLDGQITNWTAASRIYTRGMSPLKRSCFKELLREIGSNYTMLGERDSLKSIKAKTSSPVFMSDTHHCLGEGGWRYRRQDISVDAPLMARIASKAFNRDRLFRRYHLSFHGTKGDITSPP